MVFIVIAGSLLACTVDLGKHENINVNPHYFVSIAHRENYKFNPALQQDIGKTLGVAMDNTYVVKVSYWLGL